MLAKIYVYASIPTKSNNSHPCGLDHCWEDKSRRLPRPWRYGLVFEEAVTATTICFDLSVVLYATLGELARFWI